MSEEIAAMSEEITATVGQVNEAVQNIARNTSGSKSEFLKVREVKNKKQIKTRIVDMKITPKLKGN